MNQRERDNFSPRRFRSPGNRRMTPSGFFGEARLERHGAGFGSREQFIPKEEREKLSQEILATLSGLDQHLLTTSNGKDFIIDMYLAPQVETSPISPIEASKHLKKHVEIIDKIGLYRLPPEWVYARDSLIALTTFLEERERTDGRKTPYDKYLRRVSGIEPKTIPLPVLDSDRRRFINLLKQAEFLTASDDESVKAAYSRYHESQVISDKSDIEKGIKGFDTRFRNQLGSVLDIDLSRVSYQLRFVESDAPFMMWERILPEGNFLDTNWHESKRKLWGWQEIQRYAYHEGTHFVTGYLQSQEIREGRVDSVAGYLIIPGPGCWALEGVAQTIDQLAGLELSLDGEISVALYRMYVRARTNALSYLEKGEMTTEEAIHFMEKYAPHKSPEDLGKELMQGTTDPLWRAYLPIYGISDYEMMLLASNLSSDGRREKLLPQILSRPMDRKQLSRLPYGGLLA